MSTDAAAHPRPRPNRQLSRFRAQRGRRLAEMMARIAARRGDKLTILDLGGSRDYWDNIDLANAERIVILNRASFEFVPTRAPSAEHVVFETVVGDATNLEDFADQSVDLVHSNSVIEHVGAWAQIRRFAKEAKRVGRAGWIQTPAFEFPLDTHSKLPCFHWFAQPIRAGALRWSRAHRTSDINKRREVIDYITHLSYGELQYLFPGEDICIERFLLMPKSYVVSWHSE